MIVYAEDIMVVAVLVCLFHYHSCIDLSDIVGVVEGMLEILETLWNMMLDCLGQKLTGTTFAMPAVEVGFDGGPKIGHSFGICSVLQAMNPSESAQCQARRTHQPTAQLPWDRGQDSWSAQAGRHRSCRVFLRIRLYVQNDISPSRSQPASWRHL